MFVDAGGEPTDADELCPVVANGPVFCELDLAVYYDGADCERDGDGELDDDEYLTWNSREAACFERPFEDFHRVERREIEGGVAARNDAGEEREADSGHPEKGIGPGDRHLLIGDLVEEWQGEFSEADGQDEGAEGDDERLTVELTDELAAKGPDSFADADFFCTAVTAGGTEVHEIDTSQDQYEKADDAEEPDELNAAAGIHTVLKIAEQVPFIHGMQKDFILESSLVGLYMIEDRGFDLRRHLLHVGIVGDLDVEAETVVTPGVLHLADPGIGGQFEIPGHDIAYVGKAGVRRKVGIDAGHVHGGFPVHRDEPADGVCISEEGCCQGGRQQNGVGFFEGVAGTASHVEVQQVRALGFEENTGGGH